MLTENFKYIDLDQIMIRITEHPLLRDIAYSTAIRHAVDVMRKVNMPRAYKDEMEEVELIDYKARIPKKALNIKTVDYIYNNNLIACKIATDSLANHKAYIEKNITKNKNSNSYYNVYEYSLNAEHIIHSQKSGKILITYNTLVCNKDGIPMIPDNIALIKAIEEYIKVQYFRTLVDLGKLNNYSLEKAEQEYAWNIGQAQNDFKGFINEDDMESFLSDMQRLFIQNTTHKYRHKYNNQRETRIT